jgi:hypothetical protein
LNSFSIGDSDASKTLIFVPAFALKTKRGQEGDKKDQKESEVNQNATTCGNNCIMMNKRKA